MKTLVITTLTFLAVLTACTKSKKSDESTSKSDKVEEVSAQQETLSKEKLAEIKAEAARLANLCTTAGGFANLSPDARNIMVFQGCFCGQKSFNPTDNVCNVTVSAKPAGKSR